MGDGHGSIPEDLREPLNKALVRAYDVNQLQRTVRFSTGDRLSDYTSLQLPFTTNVFELIEGLERVNATCVFLRKVREERAGVSKLVEMIDRVCPEAKETRNAAPNPALSAQQRGAPLDGAPNRAAAPGFESNVRPKLRMLDAVDWVERMENAVRRVCAVEAGGASGTGFLVGPDVVLTNYHVIEAALSGGQLSGVACRFGYFKRRDGETEPGTLTEVLKDGLVDFSKYGAGEANNRPDAPPPGPHELDYALIRLAARRGDDVLADGAVRGWFSLPRAQLPLVAGAPIIIVQHPNAEPVKVALDTDGVLPTPANNPYRLRYATNTENGSSGSPVFSMNWDLVALHHYGDRKRLDPLFNQGVPAALIRAELARKGKDNWIA